MVRSFNNQSSKLECQCSGKEVSWIICFVRGLRRPTSPPKLPLVYRKPSRQLTEIDAIGINHCLLSVWMIYTDQQLLCPSTPLHWIHDGGTVIEVHLLFGSNHTQSYLSRKADYTAPCVEATLLGRRQRAPFSRSPYTGVIRESVTDLDTAPVLKAAPRPVCACWDCITGAGQEEDRDTPTMTQQQGQNVMRRYVVIISGKFNTCDSMVHSAFPI